MSVWAWMFIIAWPIGRSKDIFRNENLHFPVLVDSAADSCKVWQLKVNSQARPNEI
jgi:hypothetical protein